MKIIFFRHPRFMKSQSMPRYAAWLADGMRARGHEVTEWSPEGRFYSMPVPGPLKKWMGYIDQYLIFPRWVKKQLKKVPSDTLFVFADHALGPWVPLVADRLHVIHCHDFLAQRSALGQIPENPTSSTGKALQSMIRKGFSKGRRFISISRKTEQDLLALLPEPPALSQVVYNGLTGEFIPGDPIHARQVVGAAAGVDLTKGYILHVGGNQWYKNRKGVVSLYAEWAKTAAEPAPLLMVGPPAPEDLKSLAAGVTSPGRVIFLSSPPDELVKQAYRGAEIFLFPSLAEGFGWPIAEAMASGCPVITSNEAPMNEVAADAALYIPVMGKDKTAWLRESVPVLEEAMQLPAKQRGLLIAAGIQNAARFNGDVSLDDMERIYKDITENRKGA
ncbi:MAG: glycosyltransferase family 1 protein [Chitinophagaceae bacterium]|nr:MAG: glycosyltransferase family 1 protein [Chitinophagaceae bacterium]